MFCGVLVVLNYCTHHHICIIMFFCCFCFVVISSPITQNFIFFIFYGTIMIDILNFIFFLCVKTVSGKQLHLFVCFLNKERFEFFKRLILLQRSFDFGGPSWVRAEDGMLITSSCNGYMRIASKRSLT